MVALRLVAVGELAMTGGNFSGLSLQEQNQEILANDIALPEIDLEERQLSTTFYPQPAPAGSEARILGSLEGSQYAGQNQVVVIDQGRSDASRKVVCLNCIKRQSKSKLSKIRLLSCLSVRTRTYSYQV